MAADTLSMPKGKGGFTKLGLWMDVYAQRVWVTKLKTSATGKTSRKSYSDICDLFTASETLMTDGGPEFDNEELQYVRNVLNKVQNYKYIQPTRHGSMAFSKVLTPYYSTA